MRPMQVKETSRSQTKPKCTSIDAVVTRADGTVENFGMVSYWHRNPFRRIYVRSTSPRLKLEDDDYSFIGSLVLGSVLTVSALFVRHIRSQS